MIEEQVRRKNRKEENIPRICIYLNNVQHEKGCKETRKEGRDAERKDRGRRTERRRTSTSTDLTRGGTGASDLSLVVVIAMMET